MKAPALAFFEGELVLVTGESGAGKSALVEAIARECRAQWGWMGQAGARVGEHSLVDRPMGRCCAVVHRKSYFDPRKSVLENLNLPLQIAGLGGPRWAAKVRRAMELLELPLDERPLGPMDDLHPEFRQRLGWARALALDPQLLIVDDAMSSLRDSIRSQLLEEMKDRVRRQGTVIYATRNLPRELDLGRLRWLHLKGGELVHDEEFVRPEKAAQPGQLTQIEHAAPARPKIAAEQAQVEQPGPVDLANLEDMSEAPEDAPTLLSKAIS